MLFTTNLIRGQAYEATPSGQSTTYTKGEALLKRNSFAFPL